MTNPTIDLTTVPENDLILALYLQKVELIYITGMYYQIEEAGNHRLDEIHGYSEHGLHGAQSDKVVTNKENK